MNTNTQLWKTNAGQYPTKNNNLMRVDEGIWFGLKGQGTRCKVEIAADGAITLGTPQQPYRQSVYAPLDDAELLTKVLAAEVVQQEAQREAIRVSNAAYTAEKEAAAAEHARRIASGEIVTLGVILKRDKEKIDELDQSGTLAHRQLTTLRQTIEQEKLSVTAELRSQIAAMEKVIDEKYASEIGSLTTTIQQTQMAWNKMVHLDEFEEKIIDLLLEEHSQTCYPDSDCRGECSYQEIVGDCGEVEEYLFEHAEDFEIEVKPDDAVAATA
jgi:hypothetical protein